MANHYKENGASQPGIGYYKQREDGAYEPIITTEDETFVFNDGSKKVIEVAKGRLHWMHPSNLGKQNPIPGYTRFIEVNLVPRMLAPVHDPVRRN